MFYFAQFIKYLNQRFKEECVQYSKCTAPNDFDKNAKYCFINSPFIKKFRICGTGQKSAALYSKLKLIYRLLGPVIYTGF